MAPIQRALRSLAALPRRVRQETLTLVIPIDRARAAATIDAIAKLPETPERSFFDGKRVHFARFLVLDESTFRGSDFPSSLVFESNFDVPRHRFTAGAARRGHLADLLGDPDIQGDFFRVLRAAGAPVEPDQLYRDYEVAPTIVHQSHPWVSLERIRADEEMCAKLEDAIARYRERMSPGAGQADVLADLRRLVPDDGFREPLRETLQEVQAMKAEDPVRFPFVVPFYVLGALRVAQDFLASKLPGDGGMGRPFDPHRPPSTHLGANDAAGAHAASANENRFVQNALTHVVPVRPGYLWWLKLAHAAIMSVIRRHFAHSEDLASIPTVHFAKWLLIDGGTRLLFLSNYDLSWESYIGEFSELAFAALNVVWSAGAEYPKTLGGVRGGAEHEQLFKLWTRAYTRPTHYFYSAYRRRTVVDINNAKWIAEGLRHGPRDVGDWFRRLV